MHDLSSISGRRALAEQIKKDIDEYSVKTFASEHREHLGASVVGKECARQIWYGFRWVKKPEFDGRMLRLFNRGHREEPQLITYLKGIGFEVSEFDDNGKQFRIVDVGGHFGGSCDGKAQAPSRYGTLPKFLCEFKTKTTKTFSKLTEYGVRNGDDTHWAQMCIYGRKLDLKYALYFSVNKNDDDIYIEVCELDWNYADAIIAKASDIINMEIAPRRISEKRNYYLCNFCPMQGICHDGDAVEKNCRSCIYAKPVENAEWFCKHWNNIIPKDFIAKGCNDHKGVK